ARREVALGAVRAYYRLLEAGRLSAVAEASVTQLGAQERQAQSLFANGVIGRNDLLRAGLGLATARQRLIQSRGQTEVARGQLAAALGVPDTESLEPVPFAGEPPASSETALQEAETHAIARRVELQELAQRIVQAESGVAYARSKLVPQVSAVGNYTHTEGSPFQPVDAAYAGLVASWNVWDWGSTPAGIGQAKARLEQARLARRKADDQLRLEARRAFVESRTAREALAVARVSVTQAEENYRIVSKRFENAAATSFDVVDAEEQLTQARGQVESALYDLLIAEAALDQATGAALPGTP
ncbi:MAG: TolC family protein, partial [Myxococcales bacterium]|nr:TolC family protein [Myxococcales bacterium]